MINRGSILFAACAALMLAACGGDDEAAREDAAPAETAPAPETAEAAPEKPLDIPAEDRAQLVEACVADTGNSEAACECAAAGLGVTVINPFPVLQNFGSQVAVRPFAPKYEHNIFAVFPVDTAPNWLARAFFAYLKRSAAAWKLDAQA